MPRRYHRAPEFKREHAYVRVTLFTCVYSCYLRVLLLPAGHSGLRTYIVYQDLRVPVQCCVTRKGFSLRENLQKTLFMVVRTRYVQF